MNKITKSIQILLGVFLLCFNYNIVGQELLKPILTFGSSACDDSGTADFEVEFRYTSAFNSDNVFKVELSDGNGVWLSTPQYVAETAVNNNNPTLSFKLTFQLPNNTFGRGFKVRLVASSPAKMSPESDVFEAYKIHSGNLWINNGDKIATLCGSGTSVELKLNTDVIGEYLWFRDGVQFDTTSDPKITVNQTGKYQAKIDYKICGFKDSFAIDVIGIGSGDAQIKDGPTIEICGNEAYTFEATSNNSAYTYIWYKGTKEVQTSSSNTYTTPNAGQLGIYHLVVKLGDCEVKSDDVELKEKTAATFSITTINPGTSVLLLCEGRELEIQDVPASAIPQWYKDNSPIPAGNQLKLNTNGPGVYFARVTRATSTSCPEIVDSEKFVLLGLKSFKPEIRFETGYKECESSSVKLSIVGIKAIASDDNEYDLTDAQINATSPKLINYKWYKNNIETTFITNELEVNTYTDNDLYKLQIANCNSSITTFSNEIDVKLFEKPTVTSTSTSNSLCPGGNITYTIETLSLGYTYEWFKDAGVTAVATNVKDFDVTEIGEYTLKVTGFGCDKIVETKNVILFDDSAIIVTPSEKVVLILGQTVTITASGAESYVWHQGKDNSVVPPLSTNETLEVNSLGFYTVIATVGNCTVPKTIEVVEQDDQIIVPNIVTPNQDGINDTWQLSNKYAFQPLVTILLYNSNGKEIFKTTDYKNDWPVESLGNQKIFYYKIIKEDALIKAGTISVLD